MKTCLYRASAITFLASVSYIAEVSFWRRLKADFSCDLFKIIIILELSSFSSTSSQSVLKRSLHHLYITYTLSLVLAVLWT